MHIKAIMLRFFYILNLYARTPGTGRSGAKHGRDLNMIWMGAGSLTSVWKRAEISLTVTVNAELKQFLFHRLLPFFHHENCMCNIICLALTLWSVISLASKPLSNNLESRS